VDHTGTAYGTPRCGGTTTAGYGAWVNSGGTFGLQDARITAGVDGLNVNGVASIVASVIRGAARSIAANLGTVFASAGRSGAGQMIDNADFSQDFRRSAGSDSTSDITVAQGGTVLLGATTMRGGINVTANQINSAGLIVDPRYTGAQLFPQGIEIGTPSAVAYHRRNVVGTVSQASGIPTGGIVEQGSNANGSFTRWADGTQITFRTFTLNSAIVTGLVGGFRSSGATAAHAASFVAAPIVTATTVGLTCSGAIQTTAAGTGSAFVAVTATTSQASVVDHTLHITATGRWF
jgi:hypothetical protein